MKNLAIIMSLLFSLGLSSPLMAQNKKSRAERKREKAEKLVRQFEATKHVLENKEFVLEAAFISNKEGERVPVSSNINFILVDSTEAVIQLGNYSEVGYNGVGGITADGRVTRWELNENSKKNNFNVQMNVMTSLGMYDILMFVNADGYASARLYTVKGDQLTYTGNIVPKSESEVFQGTTTY